MSAAIRILFALELALLFAHEMDAVRKQEWKMFIVLKDMEEERAYSIFMLLHIPLYTVPILLLFSRYYLMASYIVDAFLILHVFLHWGFRKHRANRLSGGISKILINLPGGIAILHCVLLMV